MALAEFPSVPAPRVGSSRKVINPSYRSQSEGGYVSSRVRFTRPKMSYSLSYKKINSDELNVLTQFFNNNVGKEFLFTHPLETEARRCVIAMDSLDISDLGYGLFDTKFDILER